MHQFVHRRPHRLGLRARITLTFALGALVLSGLLAGTTYVATRRSLLAQRERSALEQAYVNANQVRNGLRPALPDVPELLTSLSTPAGSRPLVHRAGRWTALNLEYGPDDLPGSLRELVLAGAPARMRYDLRGELRLAIGIPLPAVDAAYFEIVSLEELEGTLRALGVSLALAAALTTLLGALLGVWVSRLALRPLGRAAEAAEAIAGGRLETRLETQDDPDLAALATSFNDMASALQSRIERDARFASDVSHELRSPLTTLAASIEVMQSRRDELPERAAAALDLMVADVARFQRLVEDLLEISRFDAGVARLNLEEVKVVEMVRFAVQATLPSPVEVAVAPGAEDLVVLADKRRMVRVVANLLDNAGSHGGGVTGVQVEPSERGVRIVVDDAGPGVPVEERELIFERFARGASAGRRGHSGEGVGLGLALVAEHVRLHGGHVWVEDVPGAERGARFVVELPAVTA